MPESEGYEHNQKTSGADTHLSVSALAYACSEPLSFEPVQHAYWNQNSDHQWTEHLEIAQMVNSMINHSGKFSPVLPWFTVVFALSTYKQSEKDRRSDEQGGDRVGKQQKGDDVKTLQDIFPLGATLF